MTFSEIKTIIQNAGVAGAGGAGFPSYAKLSEAADTVILNCAECEPLLKLHRALLQYHAEEIMTALDTVREAVGAKQAIIAVKPSYKKTVEAVKAHLDDFKSITIGLLPEVYPAGDEVVTIYETTGRVVPAGKLPITVGVTVFNVETMYNIYRAMNGIPVTHKYVTVAGEVKTPVTLRVPLGMRIDGLIALAGGATVDDYTLINGGPMTGRIVTEQDVVTKTTNGILVMPSNHYIINKRRADADISLKRAMSACCQCHMCTDLCPRNLLGHPIDPARFMRSLSSGNTKDSAAYLNTFSCSGCGLCEMFACFQSLSPRTLIGVVKDELKKGGVTPPEAKQKPVKPTREGRYVSMQRLTARLGLSKYDLPSPIKTDVAADKLKLMLSQHIGAPSVPTVKSGDKVAAGDLIATAKDGALSVPLHSPIDGVIDKVTDRYIIVKG